MPEDVFSIIGDLGGTLSSLAFSAYLIIYLLKGFAEERRIHLDKDSRNDEELRNLMRSQQDLMKESNANLIATMEKTNETLNRMQIAITELKESLHNNRA